MGSAAVKTAGDGFGNCSMRNSLSKKMTVLPFSGNMRNLKRSPWTSCCRKSRRESERSPRTLPSAPILTTVWILSAVNPTQPSTVLFPCGFIPPPTMFLPSRARFQTRCPATALSTPWTFLTGSWACPTPSTGSACMKTWRTAAAWTGASLGPLKTIRTAAITAVWKRLSAFMNSIRTFLTATALGPGSSS